MDIEQKKKNTEWEEEKRNNSPELCYICLTPQRPSVPARPPGAAAATSRINATHPVGRVRGSSECILSPHVRLRRCRRLSCTPYGRVSYVVYRV
ncbi:hypothetical protein M413DRAFT_382575 [Hebeloma cylindrosporum]|uniref:Uncharacterized protein n=1 Tax=Hebeloma cylindrosporum TaxID=76867 RepID=A0A0C3CIP7_HEBCY|nr:hypothetical protein M413DRAFT_382575 [Hebeloma cylindrosporum h7]